MKMNLIENVRHINQNIITKISEIKLLFHFYYEITITCNSYILFTMSNML